MRELRLICLMVT